MISFSPLKHLFRLLFPLLFVASFTGCSMQKLALRATGGLLDAGFISLLAEEDLPLARTAIESDLKLLEGIATADPDNEKVYFLLAQGFTSYALAFIEDESPQRARKFYERARSYANDWLIMEYDIDFLGTSNLQDFKEKLDHLSPKALPGVFWMANSWAQLLNLSLDSVASIVEFPKVEALMNYVLEHDEAYYYAGAHLFFGAYYGGKSKMLGGDPVKSEKHFARQRELTEGNFLLGDLFEVKFLILRQMDEEKARERLNYILNYDIEKNPQIRLINKVAQKKAQLILDNLEDYL